MLYVIIGPPAAGKSSWIEARATARDIVIDLDRITRALTGPGAPAWNHDRVASAVALRARYAAIDEAVKYRDERDVYLIHSMPSPKAYARYKRLSAKVVAVDPGKEIVMQRVRDMRSPALLGVATRWYRDHARQRRGQTVGRQASRSW